jgi:hypothetical protein
VRIVERTKNKKSVQYQLSRMLGIAAGVFSLVVCLLMIANNLSIKSTDPIHLPSLDKLVAELKQRPDDIALREGSASWITCAATPFSPVSASTAPVCTCCWAGLW